MLLFQSRFVIPPVSLRGGLSAAVTGITGGSGEGVGKGRPEFNSFSGLPRSGHERGERQRGRRNTRRKTVLEETVHVREKPPEYENTSLLRFHESSFSTGTKLLSDTYRTPSQWIQLHRCALYIHWFWSLERGLRPRHSQYYYVYGEGSRVVAIYIRQPRLFN